LYSKGRDTMRVVAHGLEATAQAYLANQGQS
jgi:hypothetical protein